MEDLGSAKDKFLVLFGEERGISNLMFLVLLKERKRFAYSEVLDLAGEMKRSSPLDSAAETVLAMVNWRIALPFSPLSHSLSWGSRTIKLTRFEVFEIPNCVSLAFQNLVLNGE